jgi:UDP:flavonoid glycosyltransferase YjiC (YdhE family)
MACISFLIDNREGHFYPAFGLARVLQQKGHQIVFLSIIDNKKLITDHGFSFYPIFEDIYPQGYNALRNKPSSKPGRPHPNSSAGLRKIMEGAFDPFVKAFSPDLFIIITFLCLEALLLYYKYNIIPVILTPYMRPPRLTMMDCCIEYITKLPGQDAFQLVENIKSLGIRFSTLPELTNPMASFYEIILCPEELEKDPIPKNPKVLYAGPSLRHEPDAQDKPTDYHPATRKLIYASLGTRTSSYDAQRCLSFYSSMIKAMKHPELSEFYLVLAISREYDPAQFLPLPENVRVVHWVSQLQLLQQASLIVTHGGLGTIKESIYYAVPMVVLPIEEDQPRNAQLIQYHNLGISGEFGSISEIKLISCIKNAINNESIKKCITRMSEIFKEKEARDPAAVLIEKILHEGSLSSASK